MILDESIINLRMSGPFFFDDLPPRNGGFSHRVTLWQKVPVLSAAAASAAVAGVMMARKASAKKGSKVVRLAEELQWLVDGWGWCGRHGLPPFFSMQNEGYQREPDLQIMDVSYLCEFTGE